MTTADETTELAVLSTYPNTPNQRDLYNMPSVQPKSGFTPEELNWTPYYKDWR